MDLQPVVTAKKKLLPDVYVEEHDLLFFYSEDIFDMAVNADESLAAMQAQIQLLQKDRGNLQKKESDLDSEINRFQSDRRNIEEENERLKTEIASLKAERDAFKEESEWKEKKLQARIEEHKRHHGVMSKVLKETKDLLEKNFPKKTAQ